MIDPRSTRMSLALGVLAFMTVALLLGLTGVLSLRYVNRLSSEIASRWLPSEVLIGDLNNFTSDFPASERAALLATDQGEITQHTGEMNDLDREVARSEKAYGNLRHAPQESRLYQGFAQEWTAYRAIVQQELNLLRRGEAQTALSLYRSRSISAYNAASDTLGRLTALTSAGSQGASARAAKAFQTTQALFVAAIVCVCLLMLLAAGFARWRILAPLARLSQAIRQLAANDMAVTIGDIDRADEIGDVARSVVVFRDNAIDLAISRDGLMQQAGVLQEKLIEEQRLATLQRNFISMVSHEFRTPLTTIDMHAQRLAKVVERADRDEIGQRIGRIRGAVLHMTNLISGIIETSRLDNSSSGFSFHPAAVDLDAVLHEACEFHREVSARIIREKSTVGAGRISGDRRLLFQVFSNLLSNAVKYSPPDKPIEVETEIQSHWAVVSVRDHGIGIRDEEMPHIFERFYRSETVSHVSGAGIGLYFVATAVALHGGHVSVDSKPGQGSRFHVRLPLLLVQKDQRPAQPASAS